MALKRISQLPNQQYPSLTGKTIYDDGDTTYNVTLQDLKTTITAGVSPVINGQTNKLAYFSGSNVITSENNFNVTNSGYTLSLGQSIVTSYFPERLMVDASGSFNIATFQTAQEESYAEVNIKNYGSGSNASTDLVLWNDVATESSSYVDLGINSSNYNGGQVGYGGDGYLFNQSNDIYIGSTGNGNHGHLHLFGGNLWSSSSISIYNDGTIGVNTDKFNNTANTIPSSNLGFAVQVSGSVKFDNNVKVDGFVVLSEVSSSLNFTDDGLAAAAGVPLGGLYRNGNAIMIRLT